MEKMQLSHIAFETTDACNLDCVYCYNIWKTDRVRRESFNSYKHAIAALKQAFAQADIRQVAFTGGEPFLSERFSEVILFCRMEGKQVTVISNGTMGTDKAYRELLKLGVGLFEFPVHSFDASTHDRMTRLKGSWEKSVGSIRGIIKAGGRVVPVVVITRHNVEHLGRTLDFIHSLGCDRIMLNRYNIGGEGCKAPMDVSATAQQLRRAFSVANEKALEKNLHLTANVCSPVCLLNPDDYPLIGFGHCSFDPLHRPVTLDIRGNGRLCNHSPVVAGNIHQQPFRDILYSDYSLSWETAVPELCQPCSHWSVCKGGCRAASEQCFGILHREDPIVTNLGLGNVGAVALAAKD